MNDNPYSTRAAHKQKRSASITGTLLCAILFMAAVLVSLIVISARNKAELPNGVRGKFAALADQQGLGKALPNKITTKIGRASCRERV